MSSVGDALGAAGAVDEDVDRAELGDRRDHAAARATRDRSRRPSAAACAGRAARSPAATVSTRSARRDAGRRPHRRRPRRGRAPWHPSDSRRAADDDGRPAAKSSAAMPIRTRLAQSVTRARRGPGPQLAAPRPSSRRDRSHQSRSSPATRPSRTAGVSFTAFGVSSREIRTCAAVPRTHPAAPDVDGGLPTGRFDEPLASAVSPRRPASRGSRRARQIFELLALLRGHADARSWPDARARRRARAARCRSRGACRPTRADRGRAGGLAALRIEQRRHHLDERGENRIARRRGDGAVKADVVAQERRADRRARRRVRSSLRRSPRGARRSRARPPGRRRRPRAPGAPRTSGRA